MKPVYQDRFHAEGEEFAGNCFAACIASLFEIDLHDVPMPRRDDEGWDHYWTALAIWLRARGWMLVYAGADSESPRPWTTEDALDGKEGLAILSGPGPRGPRHSVVGTLAGEILHDPHPSRAGLLSWDTVSWLVPLDPAWRWAGGHWQHSHGDGTGHYAAEWIGDEPREEKPTRG